MVDAMSKILEFSNEERALLGLKPTTTNTATPSISEKLVNYFLIDDDE